MHPKTILSIAIAAFMINTTTTLRGQSVPKRNIDSFYIFKEILMPNRAGHPEFQVGVDSQRGHNKWLSDNGTSLLMKWPGGEAWGAVFITSGNAGEDADECINNQRDTLDLSMYNYLLVDMKSDSGSAVEVGIKDKCNRNDGREIKILKQVTANWNTYAFPLAGFTRSDLKKIHVMVEFVYRSAPATIEVRNIRYVRGI